MGRDCGVMREGETARILCDLSYSIKNKVGLHELEKVLASRAIQPTGRFQGRNCIKKIYFNLWLFPTEGSISVTGTVIGLTVHFNDFCIRIQTVLAWYEYI